MRPPGEPVDVQMTLAEAPGPEGIEAQEEAEEEAIGAAMAHHEDRRVVETGRQGRQERAQTGQHVPDALPAAGCSIRQRRPAGFAHFAPKIGHRPPDQGM